MSRSVWWRARLTFTLHSKIVTHSNIFHQTHCSVTLPVWSCFELFIFWNCFAVAVDLWDYFPLPCKWRPSGVENTRCNSTNDNCVSGRVIAIFGDRGFSTRTVSTKRIGARRCGGASERSMSCVCEPKENCPVSLAMTHIPRLHGLSVRWGTDDTYRCGPLCRSVACLAHR